MSPVAKISRVLVGVDLDEASASALKIAGVLASTWDADITVFHSSTPEAPAYFTANQIETLEAEREQSRAGTADQLRVFAEQHGGRAVYVVVEEGPPEDALVRMAADFDLIVVVHTGGMAHGVGGLARSRKPSSAGHRVLCSWFLPVQPCRRTSPDHHSRRRRRCRRR